MEEKSEGVKADLETRVPHSVIINLSGMQPLLSPDKLLHGYSGPATRRRTLAKEQLTSKHSGFCQIMYESILSLLSYTSYAMFIYITPITYIVFFPLNCIQSATNK